VSKTKGELKIRAKDGVPLVVRGTLPQIMRAITRASVSLNIELEETLDECAKMLKSGEGMRVMGEGEDGER